MCCDPTRKHRLIVTIVTKTDAEGAHWSRALTLHESDDSRRVDTTGQKCSQGNVGYHLSSDRLAHDAFEFVDSLPVIDVQGLANAADGGISRRPV